MNFLKKIVLFSILPFFLLGCFKNASGVEYRVKEVIDGDTIKLENGQVVRYIGIDTPETRERRGSAWHTVFEPYSKEAKEFNRKLTEGKLVRLEFDVQKKDKYNRLLAYCFAGDVFVNAKLLEEGYAFLYTFSPNVKYTDIFVKMQSEARRNKRGLWGGLQVILAKEAGSFVNKVVTVEGRISSIYQSSRITILNFGQSKFKVAIFKKDFPTFMAEGVSIQKAYKNKNIRVTGKVKEYKGDFEIIASHPSQIELAE